MEVARRIDNVPDHAFGVDHIGHAGCDAPFFIENAPGLAGLAPGKVAEQWEFETQLNGVGAVGEGRVD